MLNFDGLVPSKPRKFFFCNRCRYHVSLKVRISFPNKPRATQFPNDMFTKRIAPSDLFRKEAHGSHYSTLPCKIWVESSRVESSRHGPACPIKGPQGRNNSQSTTTFPTSASKTQHRNPCRVLMSNAVTGISGSIT